MIVQSLFIVYSIVDRETKVLFYQVLNLKLFQITHILFWKNSLTVINQCYMYLHFSPFLIFIHVSSCSVLTIQ